VCGPIAMESDKSKHKNNRVIVHRNGWIRYKDPETFCSLRPHGIEMVLETATGWCCNQLSRKVFVGGNMLGRSECLKP
jgi:hypothetical protein